VERSFSAAQKYEYASPRGEKERRRGRGERERVRKVGNRNYSAV
jgi:hypothetical protein